MSHPPTQNPAGVGRGSLRKQTDTIDDSKIRIKRYPSTVNAFADEAWTIRANGYSPIPLIAGQKRPAMERWQAYCVEPASDEQIVAWLDTMPRAGLGVACGYGGLTAIDIDTDHGDIVASIDAVLADHGGRSPVAKVGRKGVTLFYRGLAPVTPCKLRGKSDVEGMLVEVLAVGQQTVLPPTIHPDTRRPYRWLDPERTLLNVSADDLPPIGASITDELREELSGWIQRPSRLVELDEVKALPAGYVPSDLEQRRLRAWLDAKMSARCRELAAMGRNTGRNDTLYRLVCSIGRFAHHRIISVQEMERRLRSACESNGLIRDDTWDAVLATIKSGLTMSSGDPAPYLPDREPPRVVTVDGRQVAETPQPPDSEETPYVPLVALDTAEMLEKAATPPKWCVPGLVPARQVSLLAGDGATGKTTLALQLGDARARGFTWLGIEVEKGNTIYYGAEDDRDDLHYRLECITRQVLSGPMPKNVFTIITVADSEDTELCVFERNGTLKPTKRFENLEALVKEKKATLLMLDAAADVFGGDEITRRQVRAFIRLLRGLAMRNDCAVLLLAHPSQEGMRSGTGYSGSTHWSNAVRSRMYFFIPTAEGGAVIDPDLRELALKKVNRNRPGMRIVTRWKEGVFVVEDKGEASDSLARANARKTFLDLLAALKRQGEHVSAKTGTTYAPARMAKEPEGEAIGKKALERAMHELMREGRVIQRTGGSPTRPRTFLEAE